MGVTSLPEQLQPIVQTEHYYKSSRFVINNELLVLRTAEAGNLDSSRGYRVRAPPRELQVY